MLIILALVTALLILVALWVAVHLLSSGVNAITSAYSVGCPRQVLPEIVAWLKVPGRGTILDLGCGDGRVLMAAQRPDRKVVLVGIENNPALYVRTKLWLWGRAHILFGDGLTTHQPSVDVVFAYLSPRMMAKLEPTFHAHFPSATRLVSLQFPLPERRAQHTILLKHGRPHAATLYVYEF